MIKTDKVKTLEKYKQAKKNYFEEQNETNWKAFCEAKRDCMRLGVRI